MKKINKQQVYVRVADAPVMFTKKECFGDWYRTKIGNSNEELELYIWFYHAKRGLWAAFDDLTGYRIAKGKSFDDVRKNMQRELPFVAESIKYSPATFCAIKYKKEFEYLKEHKMKLPYYLAEYYGKEKNKCNTDTTKLTNETGSDGN